VYHVESAAGDGVSVRIVASSKRTWTSADRDRAREKVGALVGELPGVVLSEMNGHTGIAVGKKRFAWLLVDHHGDGRLALCIKAPAGEMEELVAADPSRYFVPAYLGKSGWVGVVIDPASRPSWDGIAELLRQAWRASATRRAVAAYDAARRG
jgi:hypothetical protein